MKQVFFATRRPISSRRIYSLVFSLILSMLTYPGLFASEKIEQQNSKQAQQQVTVHDLSCTYNPEATQKLLQLCNTAEAQALVFDNYEISQENVETIESLLKQNADPNVYDLTEVALLDNLPLAQLLLDHKANPNPPTPRSAISFCQSVQMVELLVRAGADIHWKSPNEKENLLNGPTLPATHPEIITFLCNAGVDPNLPTSSRLTALHNLLMYRTEKIETDVAPYDLTRQLTPLIWVDADFNYKGSSYQIFPTHCDEPCISLTHCGEPCNLFCEVHALRDIVPRVRAEKAQTCTRIISQALETIPAVLISEVAHYYGKPPYDDSYWPHIEHLMITQAKAEQEKRWPEIFKKRKSISES